MMGDEDIMVAAIKYENETFFSGEIKGNLGSVDVNTQLTPVVPEGQNFVIKTLLLNFTWDNGSYLFPLEVWTPNGQGGFTRAPIYQWMTYTTAGYNRNLVFTTTITMLPGEFLVLTRKGDRQFFGRITGVRVTLGSSEQTSIIDTNQTYTRNLDGTSAKIRVNTPGTSTVNTIKNGETFLIPNADMTCVKEGDVTTITFLDTFFEKNTAPNLMDLRITGSDGNIMTSVIDVQRAAAPVMKVKSFTYKRNSNVNLPSSIVDTAGATTVTLVRLDIGATLVLNTDYSLPAENTTTKLRSTLNMRTAFLNTLTAGDYDFALRIGTEDNAIVFRVTITE